MRRINEVALLRQLHWLGSSSRVELAAALGLDPKTVTNLTRGLLRRKLLYSDGLRAAARGRPRQILRLNSRKLQAIALHLTGNAVHAGLVDFDGRIRERQSRQLNARTDRSSLIETLRQLAGHLLQRATPDVMGIGLAFPGLLDAVSGRVLECAHLPAWQGVVVPDIFSGLTDRQFVYDSFTRAKALAEQWFGAARTCADFILVDAGAGIGCSLVLNGELQTGSARLGGELGHMVIDPQGALCRCGRRGCLETVCSLEEIQRIKNREKRLPALRAAGQAMGLALANVAQLLNPSLIVITGELPASGPEFLEGIRHGMRTWCSPAICSSLRLECGQLGEAGALLGSGVLILRSLFAVDNR